MPVGSSECQKWVSFKWIFRTCYVNRNINWISVWISYAIPCHTLASVLHSFLIPRCNEMPLTVVVTSNCHSWNCWSALPGGSDGYTALQNVRALLPFPDKPICSFPFKASPARNLVFNIQWDVVYLLGYSSMECFAITWPLLVCDYGSELWPELRRVDRKSFGSPLVSTKVWISKWKIKEIRRKVFKSWISVSGVSKA